MSFELFKLDPLVPVRKMTGPPPQFLVPKQIVHIENGTKVVAGSDHGCAIIYNIQTGKDIQRLDYARGGLVQAITVSCAFFSAR